MLTKKFLSKEADGWRPFSALPCEETMKNYSSSPRLKNHNASHSTDRNSRKGFWLSALGLRFSLRDYAFCMATLLLFCLGSLFYQLNGGPPKVLLEIRQYLGKIRSLPLAFPLVWRLVPTAVSSRHWSVQHFRCVFRGRCWIPWGFGAFSCIDVFGQVCFSASSLFTQRKTCVESFRFWGVFTSVKSI